MSALDELLQKHNTSALDRAVISFSIDYQGDGEDAAAELLALRAALTDAKARAKTAEENWHKNEARIAKLEAHIKIYANENNWKSINGFMVLQTLSAPWSDAQAALKGAE